MPERHHWLSEMDSGILLGVSNWCGFNLNRLYLGARSGAERHQWLSEIDSGNACILEQDLWLRDGFWESVG